MYQEKQQLWNEFEKNGDIFSYLAYCGCPQQAETSAAEPKYQPERENALLG